MRRKIIHLLWGLLVLGVLVSQLDYTAIWNYFASTNQILAMIVLWTAAVYLIRNSRKPVIAVIPALFMTAVTVSFVFRSELFLGGIPWLAAAADGIGITVAILFLVIFAVRTRKKG